MIREKQRGARYDQRKTQGGELRGGENQERAEYGAHLLSDFLFPHVVSQIVIIHFHDIRSWY